MCSKNPEVGTLFAQFITKVFLIQRIFRVLRNSFFQNKRPVLQHSFRPSDGSMLPDRLSLKADPPVRATISRTCRGEKQKEGY